MSKQKKHSHVHEKEELSPFEQLEKKYTLPPLSTPVPLSLIIPVYNCSERIGETLESVKRQKYLTLEVIVIDAGSTDRTLEIVNSYRPMISRIYSVTDFHIVEMLNRGISLASGRYITFLFPGSIYLSENFYSQMAQVAIEYQEPELIYTGTLQREGRRPLRLLHGTFNRKDLEKGIQPSTLASSWIRSDLFERTGKLKSGITERYGFDFFCRLASLSKIQIFRLERVFVEVDNGPASFQRNLKYVIDTFRILQPHFGIRKAIQWMLSIKHLWIIRWWWLSLKQKA